MPQRAPGRESPVGPGVGECGAELLTGCLPPLQLPILSLTPRLGAQEPSLWTVSHWMFPGALPHPDSSQLQGSPVPSQLSPWQPHWLSAGAPCNSLQVLLLFLLLGSYFYCPRLGSPILISVSLLSALGLSGTLSLGPQFQARPETLILLRQPSQTTPTDAHLLESTVIKASPDCPVLLRGLLFLGLLLERPLRQTAWLVVLALSLLSFVTLYK